jgi:tagatose 6-phosphate kinase
MILVVGLSPAWQRTLVFERVVAGKVNRAQRVTETASGKGVNVARVIGQLGGEARLLTVAGGERGKLLVESLRAKQIPATAARVAAETRICQTLLSTAPTTELVEEAGKLTRTEVAAVLAKFEREVGRARLVALTGTVPAGCGEDFYARLTRIAVKRGLTVLVDAQRAQLVNAVAEGPFAVKINRDELRAADLSVRDLHRQGVKWAIITHGAEAVEVSCPEGRTTLRPPRVKALNPVGSGDAVLAGMAVGIERGWPVVDAVRLGVACGTANALTPEPGCVRLADVKRFSTRA